MPTDHFRKSTTSLRALSALTITIGIGTYPATAAEAPTAFDGLWEVTLVCPPHNEEDDAKGYTRHFPAEIKNGVFRGLYGTEGQQGSHLLTGTLAPDGKAMLKLDGVISRADYSINQAQAGKAHTYRVRAQFAAATGSGSGQRMGQRKCDFLFARR